MARNPPHASHASRLARLKAKASTRGHSATTEHIRSLAWGRDFVSRFDTVQFLGGQDETAVTPAEEDTTLPHRWRRGRTEPEGFHGHTGCVNALSWSHDGLTLASGSDDCNVILWKMNSAHRHPRRETGNHGPDLGLGMVTQLHTGHRANIFSVQFAPHGDSRIVTASMDRQVRVFDLQQTPGTRKRLQGTAKWYTAYDARVEDPPLAIRKCHRSAVKRVTTGGLYSSPDVFMSVSEDGDVREHDLRVDHTCGRHTCPRPLISAGFTLYSLSQSKLEPHLFAVGGTNPYAYLYDRRMVGRTLEEEWGRRAMMVDGEADSAQAQCVRRFGDPKSPHTSRCISDLKISEHQSDELLVTYMKGDVCLFDMRKGCSALGNGDWGDGGNSSSGSSATSASSSVSELEDEESEDQADDDDDEDGGEDDGEMDTDSDIESESEDESSSDTDSDTDHPTWADILGGLSYDMYKRLPADPPTKHAPIVAPDPFHTYFHAINVDTTKEVNFAGPRSEYIVSGSDDGKWYMWEKSTGDLLDIWHGDGDIVNVVCPHPYLPVMAVSGIDDTVRVFAPVKGESESKCCNHEEYFASRRSQHMGLMRLYMDGGDQLE